MLWQCPDEAIAALVLAHGAGAGMTHRHMQGLADAFERQRIATLRFNFAYMEEGKARVDPPAIATARIAEAFAAAQERTELPIWLGGHSFGGRMASHAVLDRHLAAVGLIFCSFPLHNPGQPAVKRAEHLAGIQRPMLFLSGTRDKLAERRLLEPLVAGLRRRGAALARHGGPRLSGIETLARKHRRCVRGDRARRACVHRTVFAAGVSTWTR